MEPVRRESARRRHPSAWPRGLPSNHAGQGAHAHARGPRRATGRGRGASPARGACLRDRGPAGQGVPGGEGARPERHCERRARVAASPHHRQPRAGRSAQRGLGLRPPDRSCGARGIQAALGGASRSTRGARRARARRTAAPGARRARVRGGGAPGGDRPRSLRRRVRGRGFPGRGRAGAPASPGRGRTATSAASRSPRIGRSSSAGSRRRIRTWPTSAGRTGRGGRSRSPRPAATTSCSPGRRGRARPCSPGGSPASCRD